MMDFVQSLSDELRDRVKNPLVPAFVLAWSVVNWSRVFLLVMSANSAEERVAEFWAVEDVSYQLWTALGAPLAIALGYVLGMPWIIVWLQRIRSKPE